MNTVVLTKRTCVARVCDGSGVRELAALWRGSLKMRSVSGPPFFAPGRLIKTWHWNGSLQIRTRNGPQTMWPWDGSIKFASERFQQHVFLACFPHSKQRTPTRHTSAHGATNSHTTNKLRKKHLTHNKQHTVSAQHTATTTTNTTNRAPLTTNHTQHATHYKQQTKTTANKYQATQNQHVSITGSELYYS